MSERRGPDTAGSPPAALRPVTRAGQAARVAWHWTMAYTQPAPPRGGASAATASAGRGLRWSRGARGLLAVAARPGLWLANLLFVARHGPEVVALGTAAACVPNPARASRGRRVLWPLVGLVAAAVAAALALVCLLLVVARGGSAGRATTATGLAVVAGAGTGALLSALLHLVLDRRRAVPDRVLHQRKTDLARAAGRPVVVGTSFGAWPRGTGDGSALLAAVLDELRADRVGAAGGRPR